MKTDIDIIRKHLKSSYVHVDVLGRTIGEGDFVAVINNSSSRKSENVLQIGIVKDTTEKFLKIQDIKSVYDEEDAFISARAVTGSKCVIINNELHKDMVKEIKNKISTPRDPYMPYIIVTKAHKHYYTNAEPLVLEGMFARSYEYLVKRLRYNENGLCLVLTKDFIFKDLFTVNKNDIYTELFKPCMKIKPFKAQDDNFIFFKNGGIRYNTALDIFKYYASFTSSTVFSINKDENNKKFNITNENVYKVIDAFKDLSKNFKEHTNDEC